MRLYLVQHGEALPKALDPDRPLSEKGRGDVERLAAFLEGKVKVSRIIHSGKTRALQTAEILAEVIAPGAEIEAEKGLAPLDPVAPFVEAVKGWQEDTLVAGHQPFLGKVVASLVAGDEALPLVAFQPGSMVCLEKEEAWSIAWMLRPELL